MSTSGWFDDLDEYTLDRYGNRVYPGDYVKCEVHGYMNLEKGERRRVISVSMYTLVMRNSASPTGTSAYNPNNFTLAGRYHAWHRSKEAKVAKNTLYVAVKVNDNPYNEIAFMFNRDSAKLDPGDFRADTSFETLRAWLNQRVRRYPDERWLILSGTVLAETSAPSVIFRQV